MTPKKDPYYELFVKLDRMTESEREEAFKKLEQNDPDAAAKIKEAWEQVEKYDRGEIKLSDEKANQLRKRIHAKIAINFILAGLSLIALMAVIYMVLSK